MLNNAIIERKLHSEAPKSQSARAGAAAHIGITSGGRVRIRAASTPARDLLSAISTLHLLWWRGLILERNSWVMHQVQQKSQIEADGRHLGMGMRAGSRDSRCRQAAMPA